MENPERAEELRAEILTQLCRDFPGGDNQPASSMCATLHHSPPRLSLGLPSAESPESPLLDELGSRY